MGLNKTSITSQMVLTIVLTSLSIALLDIGFHIWYSISQEKYAFVHESELEADLIADIVTAPLAFYDIEGVTANMQRMKDNPDVLLTAVYDSQKTVLATLSPTKKPVPPLSEVFGTRFETSSCFLWNPGLLKTTMKIEQNGQLLGYLYIEKKSDRIQQFIFQMIITAFSFSAFLMIIVYFISRRLSRKILQPVLTLTEAAKEVAEKNDYSIRVTHNQRNEIAYLYDAFNRLLSDTQSLTSELESRVLQRTQELQESLDTLKKAQVQLIQSEKMASLGNLVSGVAHEVNTPLGNAITGGSIIVHEAKELLNAMGEGTLKKSSMQQGLRTLDETATLLLKSVTQAADLIRSFKRISVDQSVEEKRDFNVHEYLEEILMTFHNKIKKVPATVVLEGDPELILKSYPGVFAQIISNFIQNSLLHAFSPESSDATITIGYAIKQDHMVLTYADNGAGMDETIKSRAFDPFITTKRNAGGTGLGLNIVYNLVTQKLRGEIRLESQPMQGTLFTIILPLEVSPNRNHFII